jgi:general secretion pathway protein C
MQMQNLISTTNRGPLIAIVSAGLALAVATVAVVVVLSRDGGGGGATGVGLDDGTAAAAQIAALDTAEVEVRGAGVVVRGGAPVLGLTEADVVRSINGRVVTDRFDFRSALQRAGLSEATVLYVEVERDGTPRLVRRKVDGNLRTAQADARQAGGGLFANPYAMPAPPVLPAPDPLAVIPPAPTADDAAIQAAIDSIIKVDDQTFIIPRSTVDTILANPMAIARGARVVPSMKNGVANGFKLYAIRPSSVYAKLGLNNGDTIQSINGFELTSPDKALDAYTRLQSATDVQVEITRRGNPLTLSYTIR